MARIATFTRETFLETAGSLIAEAGPAAATTSAIVHRMGAPVGSFYHRFDSRDHLLGELWLTLVEDYQREFLALLQAGDPVAAALFTPRWVRLHPREARILLLHRREDFVEKKWPPEYGRRAKKLGVQLQAGLRGYTERLLGAASAEAQRRVQFAVVDVPLAAVRRHVAAGEAPPLALDALIETTCRALLPCPQEVTQ